MTAFETKCDHIQWSREYTISEFVATFEKSLPQVVKVTQGFHGDYFVDAISTNEILWVHKRSHQKRVVGKDSRQRPLSIPVNFAMKLELVCPKETAPTPLSLKALLETNTLPFEVRFPTTTPGEGDLDFGTIRLNSQFEQNYLLVNCVLVGVLQSVALGFDDLDKNWTGFFNELNEAARILDYHGVTGASDIALYASETAGKVPTELMIPKHILVLKSALRGAVQKFSLDNEANHKIAKVKKIFTVWKHHDNSPQKDATAKSDGTGNHDPSGRDYQTLRFQKTCKEKAENQCPKSATVGTTDNQNEGVHSDTPRKRKGDYENVPGSPTWNSKPPAAKPPPLKPKPKPMVKPPIAPAEIQKVTEEIKKKQKEKPSVSVQPQVTENPPCVQSSTRTTSLLNIPKDLSPLSCEEIADCLRALHLDESTITVFQEKRLDGHFLTLVQEESLREFLQNETKLSTIDKERTISFAKHGWRPS